MTAAARTLLVAWATVLVGVFAAPLAAPGVLALRDMMVLDHPALTNAALGFGDLPARGTPQDAVLALIGEIMPASWFARALIVAAAAAGAAGSALLARPGGPWGMAAGMTIGVYNPFVIERLLQGQWSLVVAAWLLPLMAWAGSEPGCGPGRGHGLGRARVQLLAAWPAALTPTGGLFALVTTAFTRPRNLPVVFVMCLPWVVPGVLAVGASMSGTDAFSPRAEAAVGTLGALLGLGGIWNSAAVPPSREAGFALAGVALLLVLLAGARAVPRRLLWLAAIGLGVALAGWLLPLDQLTAVLPGGGLLRDSQKFVALAIPAYVAACRRLRPLLAGVAVVLALAQVPDGPAALQALRPIEIDQQAIAQYQGRGDVLVSGAGTMVTLADARLAVNPWSKGTSLVEPGLLVVGGEVADPPSPRWEAATAAAITGDREELARLGVAWVVDARGEVLQETGAPAAPLNKLGVGLLVAWLTVVPLRTAAGFLARRGSRARPAGSG